jgi:PhnB protein
MKLNCYLAFPGQCAEAFHFYEKALGGKLMIQSWGDSPMAGQAPEGWKDKVMHARLQIGDQVLMGSDAPPDHQKTPQGFSVSVQVTDTADAVRHAHGPLRHFLDGQLRIRRTFLSAARTVLIPSRVTSQ